MPTEEMPIHFVNRLEWGAKPPVKDLTPLHHPVPYVVLSYTTSVKSCHTESKCTKRMRALQEYEQGECGLADIRSNFYVTGDGFVYEGRGWRMAPEPVPDRPDLNGKFVEFTFINDHSEKRPRDQMLYRVKQAIDMGIVLKYLSEDFDIANVGGPEFDIEKVVEFT